MTVEKAIENYKQRLIRKAKTNGLWENFGQEEVRLLYETYSDHRYLHDGVWKKIGVFDDWCMDYTG